MKKGLKLIYGGISTVVWKKCEKQGERGHEDHDRIIQDLRGHPQPQATAEARMMGKSTIRDRTRCVSRASLLVTEQKPAASFQAIVSLNDTKLPG